MIIFVSITCIVAVFPALFFVGFISRLLWTTLYLGWQAAMDVIVILLREKR